MSDWIEWMGGECPLPAHTPVEVIFRDTEDTESGYAHEFGRFWGCEAEDAIISYRVVTE